VIRVYDEAGNVIETQLCVAPLMQQGLFCGVQHQLVSYDNEFTVRWRRGFDCKQRP